MSFHQVQVLGQAGIAWRALCIQCWCLVLHNSISCQGRPQGQERLWTPQHQCFCYHSQQDLPSAALLHSSFPGESTKSLPSSTCEPLPLSLLLLHLVDHFLLLLFCYEPFILRRFGFFCEINSVLNQYSNYLLFNFSLGLSWQRGQCGRLTAIWKIINISTFLFYEAFRKVFFPKFFFSKDLTGTLKRAPAIAGLMLMVWAIVVCGAEGVKSNR